MGRALNITDHVDAEAIRGGYVAERRFGPFEILASIDPVKAEALIQEANQHNTVTVAVYRATRGMTGIRHKRTEYERHDVVGQAPSLALADIGRMLNGDRPVYLDKALALSGGELVGAFKNLRTNVGVDYCAAQLSGTSVAVADTIALSANTLTPSATDAATTLPWNTAQTTNGGGTGADGEFTTYGSMARAAATYAHTVGGPAAGNASYTLTHTWTASATVTNVRLAGLFGGSGKAAQGGTNVTNMLFLESAFTTTTLSAADQLALTWTVNI